MSVRFKPLPDPPADRDALADAQGALPLVPKGEDDCCARLRRRTDLGLDARDEARAWLTVLRALGLAERADGRFVRTDRDPSSPAVAAAFEERVFGAREALSALEGGGTLDDAAAAVEAAVPRWERDRRHDWRRYHRERTARLLDWAALLGLVERDGDAYRRR